MSRISGFGSSTYSAIVQQVAARRTSQVKAPQAKAISATRDPFSVEEPKLAQKVDAALGQVGDLQANADKMVLDLASGRDVNVHNTMVELAKADIALKYTVQLRNRALSAYEELMRIQV